MKLKGSSTVIKRGTVIKIHLTDNAGEIEGKRRYGLLRFDRNDDVARMGVTK